MPISSNFPVIELGALIRSRIKVLSADVHDMGVVGGPVINWCHWTPSGQYSPWVGFRKVFEEMQAASGTDVVTQRHYLIFGPHSSGAIPANEDTAILGWPGVKYLRYDVSDADLLAAISECQTGCKQPLPPGLQQGTLALIRQVKNVRHQFRGLIALLLDQQAHLQRVLKGEQFHRGYAMVLPIFTKAQEEMLERFVGYATLAATLAPETQGLAPYIAALQELRRQWDAISELMPQAAAGEPAVTLAALTGWKQIEESVEGIISSLESLEEVLGKNQEKDK